MLYYGGDEYLVAAHAKRRVDELCPLSERALSFELIECKGGTLQEGCASLEQCMIGLQTVGLFQKRKIVWLKDAFFLSAKHLRSEALQEQVRRFVKLLKAGLSPDQFLIITSDQVDGRSALIKACKSVGEVVEYRVPEKSYQVEEQARQRAMELFKKAGLTVGENVLESFLARTGAETRQIVQEVNKLSVYLGKRSKVTLADIQGLVCATREAAAWDLADAVGQRQISVALQILRQLLFQRESALGLLIGIETRIRDLLLFKSCLDAGWVSLEGREPWLKLRWRDSSELEEVCSALPVDPRKIHPYRAAKLAAQAQRYTLKALVRASSDLLSTHESLISRSTPVDVVLEALLIRIMTGDVAKP